MEWSKSSRAEIPEGSKQDTSRRRTGHSGSGDSSTFGSVQASVAADPNVFALCEQGYQSCVHLNQAYLSAVQLLKTPVAKVCSPGDKEVATDVFMVKQSKLKEQLDHVIRHLRVVRTNGTRLKSLFPDEKQQAQDFLLGQGDSCRERENGESRLGSKVQDRELNDRINTNSEDIGETKEELHRLRAELKTRNERLAELREELVKMTSS